MATKVEKDNPYAPPTEKIKPAKRPKKKKSEREEDASDRTKEAIMDSFRKTRTWVSLFSVLGYITTVLLVIGGLGTLMGRTFTSGPLGGYSPILAFFYLGMALFSAFVANRLGAYRGAIDRVLQSNCDMDEVAIAIERQRQYWSLVGGGTMVMIVVYVIGIFAIVVASR